MMYKFYLDGVLMPVTPGSLTLKIKDRNETVDLINGGVYTVLNPPGLTEYSFECILPATNLPFAQYNGDFKDPQYYISKLENLKGGRTSDGRYTPGEKFQFHIIRSSDRNTNNLNAVEDTNVEVVLTDLTIIEDAEEVGMGKKVQITLTQYQVHETKILKQTSSGSYTETTESYRWLPIVKEGTYITREGDTLPSIAYKYLGDEKYAEALAKYQNPSLEEYLWDTPLPVNTVIQIDVTAIKNLYNGITVNPDNPDIWIPDTYVDGIKRRLIDESTINSLETQIEISGQKPTTETKKQSWWDSFKSKSGRAKSGVTPLVNAITSIWDRETETITTLTPMLQFAVHLVDVLESFEKYLTTAEDDDLKNVEKALKEAQAELDEANEIIEANKTELEKLKLIPDVEESTLTALEQTIKHLTKEIDETLQPAVDELTETRDKILEDPKANLGTGFKIDTNKNNEMKLILQFIKDDTTDAALLTGWVESIGLLDEEDE